MDSVIPCISGASCEPVNSHCPKAARLAINAGAHVSKNLGNVLDLIQQGGRFHRVEKPLGIGSKASHDVRVFEQKITRLGEQIPQKPGFSGPPRAGQHQRRESAHGRLDLRFKLAVEVPHG